VKYNEIGGRIWIMEGSRYKFGDNMMEVKRVK
jgi:hypothetical protein